MSDYFVSIFIPVAKYIAASALLLLFYLLFFKGKTSYAKCRVYLLSIAIISILLSQFRVELSKPEIKYVEIEMPVSDRNETINEKVNYRNSDYTEMNESSSKNLTNFELKTIPLAVYLLVTLVLFTLLIIQYIRIMLLKKKGKLISENDYDLVVNKDVPTPFSFCKTIFINENLSGKKRDAILEHEKYHIYHHHYLDVLIMEFFTRLLWFNPVLWLVRRELKNISEFQADRSVLDDGHELYSYQTLILEELMGQNSFLTNGFNNSFTKKRFITMKNKNTERLTLIRRVLIVPFFAGIFCLLSISTAESQVKYVVKQKNTTHNQNHVSGVDTAAVEKALDIVIDTAVYVPKIKTPKHEDVVVDTAYIPNTKTKKNEDVIVDTAVYFGPKKINKYNQQSKTSGNENFLKLKPGQIQIVDENLADKMYAYSIVNDNFQTSLTIAFPISNENQWLSIGENFMLVDKKTNDRYMIRWVENEIPFDKKFVHPGCVGKTIGITLVFPRLKKSVKMVDLIEPVPAGGFGENVIGLSVKNIDVVALSKKKTPKVYE